MMDLTRSTRFIPRPSPPTIASSVRQWAETPVLVILGAFSLFAVGFFNLLDVQVGKDDVGLDAQVLIKLGCSFLLGVYGTIGVLTEPKVRRVLLTYPAVWLLAIIGFYFLAVPFAYTPMFALASALVLSLVVIGTITAAVHLGIPACLNILFFSMALYNFGSWFTYLLVPEIGVYLESTTGGRFVPRMAGLAHPNTLGQFSGLTVVLGVTLWTRYDRRSLFRWIVIVSAMLTLYLSFSRTSMIATVLAVGVGYRQEIFRKENQVSLLILTFIGVALLSILLATTDFAAWLEEKLIETTKSGDASELTTATGRADIWQYTLRLIGDSPLFGYGAASSKYLLADYSMYTHNLVLNVALSTGFVGGLAALMMCLFRVGTMLRRVHPVADGLAAFILLNGLFENVIFSLLAGLPTMLWVIALTWWQYPQEEGEDETKSNREGRRNV